MAKEEKKEITPVSSPAARVVDKWFADHFHGCSHPWFTTEIYNHIY